MRWSPDNITTPRSRSPEKRRKIIVDSPLSEIISLQSYHQSRSIQGELSIERYESRDPSRSPSNLLDHIPEKDIICESIPAEHYFSSVYSQSVEEDELDSLECSNASQEEMEEEESMVYEPSHYEEEERPARKHNVRYPPTEEVEDSQEESQDYRPRVVLRHSNMRYPSAIESDEQPTPLPRKPKSRSQPVSTGTSVSHSRSASPHIPVVRVVPKIHHENKGKPPKKQSRGGMEAQKNCSSLADAARGLRVKNKLTHDGSVPAAQFLALQRKVHEQTEEITSQAEQIIELKKKEAHLRRQNEKIQDELINSEKVMEAERLVASEQKDETARIRLRFKDFEKSKDDIVRLQKEVTDKHEEMERMRIEMMSAQKKLKIVEKYQKKMIREDEHQRIQGDLKGAEERNKELEKELVSSRENILKLKRQLKQVATSNLSKELKEAKSEAQQLMQLVPMYQELEKKEMASKARADSLEMNLSVQQAKFTEQSSEYRELRIEHKKVTDEVKRLKEEALVNTRFNRYMDLSPDPSMKNIWKCSSPQEQVGGSSSSTNTGLRRCQSSKPITGPFVDTGILKSKTTPMKSQSVTNLTPAFKSQIITGSSSHSRNDSSRFQCSPPILLKDSRSTSVPRDTPSVNDVHPLSDISILDHRIQKPSHLLGQPPDTGVSTDVLQLHKPSMNASPPGTDTFPSPKPNMISSSEISSAQGTRILKPSIHVNGQGTFPYPSPSPIPEITSSQPSPSLLPFFSPIPRDDRSKDALKTNRTDVSSMFSCTTSSTTCSSHEIPDEPNRRFGGDDSHISKDMSSGPETWSMQSAGGIAALLDSCRVAQEKRKAEAQATSKLRDEIRRKITGFKQTTDSPKPPDTLRYNSGAQRSTPSSPKLNRTSVQAQCRHLKDLVYQGQFEIAIDILRKRIGAHNTKVFKPIFERIYFGGQVEQYPMYQYTESYFNNLIKEALDLVSNAHFYDACEKFQISILQVLPLAIATTVEEEGKLHEYVEMAKNYILAIKVKIRFDDFGKRDTRQLSEKEYAYILDLVSLLSACNLRSEHKAWAYRQAMHLSYEEEKFTDAIRLAQQLLNLNIDVLSEGKEIHHEARDLLDLCSNRGIDISTISPYQIHADGILCSRDLCRIPQGATSITCGYCHAAYQSHYISQVCSICNIAEIGCRDVEGVQFRMRNI